MGWAINFSKKKKKLLLSDAKGMKFGNHMMWHPTCIKVWIFIWIRRTNGGEANNNLKIIINRWPKIMK